MSSDVTLLGIISPTCHWILKCDSKLDCPLISLITVLIGVERSQNSQGRKRSLGVNLQIAVFVCFLQVVLQE